MKREHLEHILRASSVIAEDTDVVVVGSQSILGSFGEAELPERAYASIEADVSFFEDDDNDKSDRVDMHLGEDSQFHATFCYYAQGVNVEVAVLPSGWRERVVTYTSPNTNGATAHCLEPHDLVVSKLVAGRAKDMEFADALLGAGLVDADEFAGSRGGSLGGYASAAPHPHQMAGRSVPARCRRPGPSST
jgi:hypothetical protein